MIKHIRKIVKALARKFEFEMKMRMANFLKFLFVRKVSSSIYFAFDSDSAVDGTGAQLQRLTTLIAFAKDFGFNYVHSPIKQVSVHPLDPFQSKQSYNEYLNRLNNFLNFNNVKLLNDFGEKWNIEKVHSLSFNYLIKLYLRQKIDCTQKLISVFNPYPVTEFLPSIFDDFNIDFNDKLVELADSNALKVVIHYRQGVGGFVQYPGQKIAREIPLERFTDRLSKIIEDYSCGDNIQIVVVTDAPETETTFEPPSDQIALWEGTPKFSSGVMRISPTHFHTLGRFTRLPLEIKRGGNPLDAIVVMASADVFLGGKSSLSYMGGLLNKKGVIFFPEEFWHRPLKKWKKL